MPPSTMQLHRCDHVEVNTVTDQSGNPTLEQVIFWSFDFGFSDMVVRQWVRREHMRAVEQTGDGFIITMLDEKGNRRRIAAYSYTETRTPYDPERINLQVCPEAMRFKLY